MITTPKIMAGGLLLAGVVGLVLAIRADGARSITNAFERQNNAAAHSAGDARSEFDTCIDGLWDFGAGKCRRSQARSRH
ncbi:hypothetical protein [Ensifer adhaerens]|uniref:Uncharacterized protein n=1 Tax=Ensifer adhaerens TaxID=106592 RepID=A0A9Q8Y9I6_ENSAD|nr:hypothetical protein [Ensifer adhaerens]USJ24738.1 hypothetical protein NE863_07160 [Ensifer adhaerens]